MSETPDRATVRAAIVSAIDAVNPAWGTVLSSDLRFESELQAIKAYQQGSGGNQWAIDLWAVKLEKSPHRQGKAVGEVYVDLGFVAQYWNVRSADSVWEATADTQVKTAVAAISGNSGIFRIGGQIQIGGTPEIAVVESQGFEMLEEMKVYKAKILIPVESRFA
jgi:hypothetical protein